MFIRLFILCVLLLCPYNFSYGEDKTASSEEEFKRAMLLLENNINGLSRLAKGVMGVTGVPYIPAQQLLGLLSTDFNKANLFLEDINKRNLRPHLPRAGHSRGFFRHMLDVYRGDISPAAREADTFMLGGFFLDSVDHLIAVLNLLDKLAKQDYAPAKKLQENFEGHVKQFLEKSDSIIYHPSVEQGKECEATFKTYFRPDAEQ